MSASESLKRLIWPQVRRTEPAIPAGLHAYTRERGDGMARVHLRVEPDGQGLLLVNATGGARLSTSGVFLVRGLLEGQADEQLIAAALERFRDVSAATISADIERLRRLLDELATPDPDYPVRNLADASLAPSASRFLAPLMADLTLPDVQQIRPILERLWDVGIPHAIAHAGRDPDAAALVRAVECAEDLGMIAGVRARATDLAPGSLFDDLVRAGVDHLALPLAAPAAAVHDSLLGQGDHAAALEMLNGAREAEICPVALLPLCEANVDLLDETVEFLLDREIHTIQAFALASPADPDDPEADTFGALPGAALPQVAMQLDESADRFRVNLVTLAPVQRRSDIDLSDQLAAGPRCSGEVAIRIEPDGSVLPATGPRQVAGNLLSDEWTSIWGHKSFARFRESVEPPEPCPLCPGLALCDGGCLMQPENWSSE